MSGRHAMHEAMVIVSTPQHGHRLFAATCSSVPFYLYHQHHYKSIKVSIVHTLPRAQIIFNAI